MKDPGQSLFCCVECIFSATYQRHYIRVIYNLWMKFAYRVPKNVSWCAPGTMRAPSERDGFIYHVLKSRQCFRESNTSKIEYVYSEMTTTVLFQFNTLKMFIMHSWKIFYGSSAFLNLHRRGYYALRWWLKREREMRRSVPFMFWRFPE